MVEQTAMFIMLYRGQQDALENLIGPTGQIAFFQHSPSGWTPSYCLVKFQDGRKYLTIAGTTNAPQVAAQTGGALVTVPYGRGGLASVSTYWLSAFNNQFGQIETLMDLEDPTSRYYVSGHSLGGAVAQLWANYLAEKVGSDRVSLITFGAPKPITGIDVGPQPSTYWNVQSTYDQVPNLPSNAAIRVVQNFVLGKPWILQTSDFRHYGVVLVIDPKGRFNTGVDRYVDQADSVQVGTITEHNPDQYLHRSFQTAIEQLKEEASQDAYDRGINAWWGQNPLPWVGPLQFADTGLPGEYKEIYERYVVGVARFSSGGSMATQRHRWEFVGNSGERWVEVYSVNKSEDPQAALALIPQEMIDARVAFLNAHYTLRTIYASLDGLTKNSAYRRVNAIGTDASSIKPALPGGRTPLHNGGAAVYDVQGDPSGRRFIWFRGLADESVNRGAQGNDLIVAGWRTVIEEFIKLLAGYGYGIRRRVKAGENPGFASQTVSRVDGAITPGWAWIYCDDPESAAQSGRVYLSRFNKKLLPGLEGLFTVQASDPVAVAVAYSTPNYANFPEVVGSVRPIELSPVSVFVPASAKLSHLGFRQTSRSFTRTRGRAHSVSIRNIN